MRLSPAVRRRAEVVLDAVLPGAASGDTSTFWRHLEEDGAPVLAPGLVALLAVVELWPLRRWRAPFSRLSPEARVAFLESLDRSPSPAARQVLGTWKVLACFARFDDPAARRGAGVDP